MFKPAFPDVLVLFFYTAFFLDFTLPIPFISFYHQSNQFPNSEIANCANYYYNHSIQNHFLFHNSPKKSAPHSCALRTKNTPPGNPQCHFVQQTVIPTKRSAWRNPFSILRKTDSSTRDRSLRMT